MVISIDILLMLFAIAMLAGLIDAIAGGGGLLTVPVLLIAGLSPAQAIATNKLQSVGGSFSASLYFIRRREVNLVEQMPALVMTFLGAAGGAFAVQYSDPSWLKQILPLLVIAVGFYFLLMPKIGEEDRHRRVSSISFGLLIGSSIGFYDGFLGPGTGSFFCLAYLLLVGYTLKKSTAHAKVLNFTSNLAALLFFIFSGQVIWLLGFVMLVGQIIGARIGASLVLSQGSKLIRPLLVTLSMIMSIKLLYDVKGGILFAWLVPFFE